MIPYDFQCPNCSQSLEIPGEMLGQRIDCPVCNNPIELPRLEDTEKEVPTVPRPAPPSTPPEADTKPCPLCGETIKKVAVKCRFCNEDFRNLQQPQQQPQQQESVIETDIFCGHPAAIYSVGQWVYIVLTIGLAYFFYRLESKSTKYKITSQRLTIERGILSKTKSHIELFRIDDFDLLHPLGMRLLGYGILNIKSSDRNVPTVRLVGVRNVDSLYEQIRSSAQTERERRGIKVWANA